MAHICLTPANVGLMPNIRVDNDIPRDAPSPQGVICVSRARERAVWADQNTRARFSGRHSRPYGAARRGGLPIQKSTNVPRVYTRG